MAMPVTRLRHTGWNGIVDHANKLIFEHQLLRGAANYQRIQRIVPGLRFRREPGAQADAEQSGYYPFC
jgi:hypothetical protein